MTKRKIKQETKKEMKRQIQEMIPAMHAIAEVIEEDGDELMEAAEPLLKLYRALIVHTSEEITLIAADNVILAVKKLEENGFSREEAISLLKR